MHTKGPWQVQDATKAGEYRILAYEQMQIAATHLCGPDDLSNARLIAAAPELLAACEYVVKYHREHDSGEGELYGLDFVTSCIAAIRKATE